MLATNQSAALSARTRQMSSEGMKNLVVIRGVGILEEGSQKLAVYNRYKAAFGVLGAFIAYKIGLIPSVALFSS